MNLFAYGTLMSAPIMARVSRLRPDGVEAVLSGFRRYAVKGAAYPGVVPESGAQVPGVLYWDIPAVAWPRLDRFEGAMYRRLSVEVAVSGGGTEAAEVYVLRGAYRARLAAADWDFAAFERRYGGAYRGE